MENVYRNFYQNFYRRSSGFIPVALLGQAVLPGDFFQIRNGQMIVLGNIFRNNVIEVQDIEIGYNNKLNPSGWSFSDGVTKPYSGRGSGRAPLAGEFEFSKQILAFAEKGSFIFKASEPESTRMLNWNEIQQALIIRLTQTYYSFREVYVVTDVATTADWTLAVSGGNLAELEIATDEENFGLVDLFGHHSSKTIQSKDIEFYHREEKRKPSFYKAKKLVVREEKVETLVSELIAQWRGYNDWALGFYEYDFHYDHHYVNDQGAYSQGNILDLLAPNELNPNTALLYFKWADANLDDVEKLFNQYGE
ncbi:hypothetical protein SAMN05421827_10937 [Pedobacter terrae]|uniref:Uncharacterized protein n=1 Tax=Pedobacter terrae TaxID=405671 RepID=A0A1G7VZV6_9SPHI|nr:hypothetical protein [Pedobacter terrae]SDG65292.1 hypothetical protein SAMN05421827_10937 [Pedobacter terrae]